MPIRRDGNISHLFISLATQRSMGKLQPPPLVTKYTVMAGSNIAHGKNVSFNQCFHRSVSASVTARTARQYRRHHGQVYMLVSCDPRRPHITFSLEIFHKYAISRRRRSTGSNPNTELNTEVVWEFLSMGCSRQWQHIGRGDTSARTNFIEISYKNSLITDRLIA